MLKLLMKKFLTPLSIKYILGILMSSNRLSQDFGPHISFAHKKGLNLGYGYKLFDKSHNINISYKIK